MFNKFLTVRELSEILNTLDPDIKLYPNDVKNLTIVSEEEYIGYIDFMDKSVEIFENDND